MQANKSMLIRCDDVAAQGLSGPAHGSGGKPGGSDLSLSGKASKCSNEAAMELSQLRALQGQAQHTVMLCLLMTSVGLL